VIDLEYFPRRSNLEGSIRVNLVAYLFDNEIQTAIRFCVRFLGMRFSTKVFEHAKITR